MGKPSRERISTRFPFATTIIEEDKTMDCSPAATHIRLDLNSDTEVNRSYSTMSESRSLDDVNPEEWDEVMRPKRYAQGDIEAWDAMHAAMTQEEWNGMCKGTIIGYLWREQHKGGKTDLLKAKAWLEKWIATYDS